MQRLSSVYNQLLEYASRAYHSLLFPAGVVFIVVVLVALWASRTAAVSLERNLQSGMEAQAQLVQRTTSLRFQNHEQTLRSNAALLQSGDVVDQAHWHSFLESYDHRNYFPALISVGVARYDANQSLKADYIWPADSNPVIGEDLKLRRDFEALMKRATASYEMNMVPDERSSSQLLLGLPLYPNGETVANGRSRTSKPVGLVYGRIDATTFFDKVLTTANLSELDIQIYKGTDTEPLYSSPGFGNEDDHVELTKTFHFYGQPLRVMFRFPELSLVSKTQLDGPILIAGGGALAGLLIASIVYLLLVTRAKELQMEKTHDVELAKDDLLSLASHQLRTPATGVKQYLGMVLQGFAGSVTDRQRSLLEKAFASNDRQLGVINEVLHMAKIESGRISLAKQDINISDLVQDVVNEQTPDIKRAQHAVTVQLPLRPIMVHADNHMLRMAIENVISNAIKYTPAHGKIKVTVVGSRQYVRIAVKDSGIGIDEEDIPKLFKQFTRLQNELSFQVSGTGVGLYLVKHLIELHGGKVSVTSEKGKGSTFTIILPRRHNTDKR